MNTEDREQVARLATVLIVRAVVRRSRKRNSNFSLTGAEIAAIIAAVLSTGTAIYTSDKSRKAQHQAQDAAKEAADKQFAQQQELTREQQAASEKSTSEQEAAAMRRRAGELQGQTGAGSVSPEFYSSVLSSEFPSAGQDDIAKAVQSFFSGGKG